jgi:hypothetical protein
MGWGTTVSPSTAYQKIRLESGTGVGRFAGGVTSTGFDYAEYFENHTNGIIPDGTIVTLIGDKIAPAMHGDFILGTISATYGVLGNAPDFAWAKQYLTDEFGRHIMEDVEFFTFDGVEILVSEYDPTIHGEEIGPTAIKKVQKINPEFDLVKHEEYKTRGERPEEYSIVALMGQVFVRVYEDIPSGVYVSADGRKTAIESKLYAMKMTTPFDPMKGYGVCKCLLR